MDGVLARWNFPFTAENVPTRFGPTHTVTAGDKNNPALILLHGAAFCLLGWRGDIPVFSGYMAI